MRTPLSACCNNSRSLPCAEVDGCVNDIVSVFRIAGLVRSISALPNEDGVGLETSAVSLLVENLLEKD